MANTAELQLVVSLRDQASKGLGGISKSVGALGTAVGVFAGGAALAGVRALSGAVSGFLGDAITESRDAAKGLAQTEAVIKSTGGAAKITSAQIVEYAGALSKTTLFSDDAIQANQNLLLTFTGIRNEVGEGNDIFNQANKISLDLAQAMGTDAAGGALQLGKALNDPTKGISALTRVGVTFTKQQKDQIKALQASGDMMGAQKIILAELNKEFGGSAAAAAKADGGFHLFQQRLADVKQTVGDALMPALTGVMDLMSGPVLDAVESLGQSLAGGLTTAVAWLTSTGIPALTAGWAAIQPALAAVGGFITGTLVPALMSFGGWIVTIGKDLAAGDWPGAFAAITTGLSEFATTIGTTLLTWGQAFVDWIGPRIPDILAGLGTIATTVVGWIGEQVPIVLAKLGEWGTAFIAWVPIAIADIQAALPGIWTTVSTWIGEQAGKILTQVGVWGDQFVAWIPTAITDIQAALPGIWTTVSTWIGEQGAKILTQVSVWGTQFIAWIPTAITNIQAALPGIWTSVSTWITETAAAIVTKLIDWGTAFSAWIGPAIPPFLESLGAFAVGIGTAIVNGVPVIVEKVKLWADALVNWITEVAAPALQPAFDVFMANLRTGADRASVVLSDAGNKAGIALVDGLKLGWANAPVETNNAMLGIAAEITKSSPNLNLTIEIVGKAAIDAMFKQMNTSSPGHVTEWGATLAGLLLDTRTNINLAAIQVGLDAGTALHTEFTRLINAQKAGVIALGVSVVTWVRDGIKTAENLVGYAAGQIGAAILAGITGPLAGLAAKVAEMVNNALRGAMAIIRATQLIKSPSQLWADEIGAPLVQGIAQGFTSGMPRLLNTITTGVSATVGAAVNSIQSGSGGVADAIRKLLTTGDFTGGIFGKSEDDPFIDFLLKARKDATALKNILALLATKDFKGGILGLSEDDPFITALLKAAEAAKKLGGSHIGPANTGGSFIGPLKQAIADLDAGMSITGPNLADDFAVIGDAATTAAAATVKATDDILGHVKLLGGKSLDAFGFSGDKSGGMPGYSGSGGGMPGFSGGGDSGGMPGYSAGSDAGMGFGDGWKSGIEQIAPVIQDTTRMTFQQLHEVVLLPWQEDTRTFFGGAGFGFIGAASVGIMSAAGGLAQVAGTAGGAAGSALASGLQGSVPAATAAIGAIQAALNTLQSKTVTITIHTVHTDDGGGGGREGDGFLDGLRGIGAQ